MSDHETNDIVKVLREGVFGAKETKTDPVIHLHMQNAADEIERLRAGLMKAMQYENKCDQTAKPCRESSRCGCYLEAENWCVDSIGGDPGRI